MLQTVGSFYTISAPVYPAPLLGPRIKICCGITFQRTFKPIMRYSARRGVDVSLRCIATASVGRGYSESKHEDEFSEEPFWLSLIKDIFRAIKSFFSFLIEQPRQLRYIEWPTFSNTLKTATLTLVLVALLIVALATVDSGLCYLLALFLRRKP